MKAPQGLGGSFGDPFRVPGVRESLGRVGRSQGGSRGVPEPWDPASLFLEVNCQLCNEILTFSVWCPFVKRSMVVELCTFCRFSKLYFEEQ